MAVVRVPGTWYSYSYVACVEADAFFHCATMALGSLSVLCDARQRRKPFNGTTYQVVFTGIRQQEQQRHIDPPPLPTQPATATSTTISTTTSEASAAAAGGQLVVVVVAVLRIVVGYLVLGT